MPAGFSEFEHCLNNDDVDVANDEFQLQSTSGDGVCITSLSINGNPILVGASNNLQSFWIDSDGSYCLDNFMSSSQITIRNGRVISLTCKGTSYFLSSRAGMKKHAYFLVLVLFSFLVFEIFFVLVMFLFSILKVFRVLVLFLFENKNMFANMFPNKMRVLSSLRVVPKSDIT